MKTLVFFVSALLIPAFLFSQGLGQRQISSQTSNSGFQAQQCSYSLQQVQPTSTYQIQQTVQPTIQQQSVQQNQTDYQSHSQLQNGYNNTKIERNSNNEYSNSKSEGKLSDKNYGSNAINISNVLSKTITVDKGNVVSQKKHINNLVRPRPIVLYSKLNGIATTNYPIGVDANIKNLPEKLPKSVISPAKVYWLTPTVRLLNCYGSARRFSDIDGYGVYAGSFNNYQYCLAVSNWLRKKYKAEYFIFEDISHGVHFHLVFGRWVSHYSATIFRGKVSEDVPYAYIVRWTQDFKVFGFDQNLIYPKP